MPPQKDSLEVFVHGQKVGQLEYDPLQDTTCFF